MMRFPHTLQYTQAKNFTEVATPISKGVSRIEFIMPKLICFGSNRCDSFGIVFGMLSSINHPISTMMGKEVLPSMQYNPSM